MYDFNLKKTNYNNNTILFDICKQNGISYKKFYFMYYTKLFKKRVLKSNLCKLSKYAK